MQSWHLQDVPEPQFIVHTLLCRCPPQSLVNVRGMNRLIPSQSQANRFCRTGFFQPEEGRSGCISCDNLNDAFQESDGQTFCHLCPSHTQVFVCFTVRAATVEQLVNGVCRSPGLRAAPVNVTRAFAETRRGVIWLHKIVLRVQRRRERAPLVRRVCLGTCRFVRCARAA